MLDIIYAPAVDVLPEEPTVVDIGQERTVQDPLEPEEFTLFFQSLLQQPEPLGLVAQVSTEETALPLLGDIPNRPRPNLLPPIVVDEGQPTIASIAALVDEVLPGLERQERQDTVSAQPPTVNVEPAVTVRAPHTAVQTVVSADTNLGSEIAFQATRAIRTETVSFQQQPSQQIVVEINPPELGRMSIQVEVQSDQLSAHIVTSEWVSAELLSREKDVLVQALENFGFTETSVDISHDSTDADSEESTEFAEAGEVDGEPLEMPRQNKQRQLVGVNIVV